jgi:hypothetical protein
MGTFGCLYFLYTENRATKNIVVQMKLCHTNLIFPVYLPSSGNAGYDDGAILIFEAPTYCFP